MNGELARRHDGKIVREPRAGGAAEGGGWSRRCGVQHGKSVSADGLITYLAADAALTEPCGALHLSPSPAAPP